MCKYSGKKIIENHINDIFLSMHFKDVFTTEFLSAYIRNECISNMIIEIISEDLNLYDIDDDKINKINYILKNEYNHSNIHSYNELKEKAKEYLILKRMSDLNIL